MNKLVSPDMNKVKAILAIEITKLYMNLTCGKPVRALWPKQLITN
jgi:hypothetical protein